MTTLLHDLFSGHVSPEQLTLIIGLIGICLPIMASWEAMRKHFGLPEGRFWMFCAVALVLSAGLTTIQHVTASAKADTIATSLSTPGPNKPDLATPSGTATPQEPPTPASPTPEPRPLATSVNSTPRPDPPPTGSLQASVPACAAAAELYTPSSLIHEGRIYWTGNPGGSQKIVVKNGFPSCGTLRGSDLPGGLLEGFAIDSARLI